LSFGFVCSKLKFGLLLPADNHFEEGKYSNLWTWLSRSCKCKSKMVQWSINQSINQSIELLLVVSYMFLINSPNNWLGRRCWSCHLVNYYYICGFAKIVIRENDVLFFQSMWCKNRMTPKKKKLFFCLWWMIIICAELISWDQ